MDGKRFIEIVGAEIVIGSICLGMLSVRTPCAQSVSSQVPAKTPPRVSAEYDKPVLDSEVNGGRIRVEWRQGKLSVNAERALLSRVLEQVSAQTGIEFLNLDKLHGQTSVHFSNVPLRVGLQILLADMDYGAIGGPGDPSTMRIVIFERAMRESAKATPTPERPVQAVTKDAPHSPFQSEDLGPTTDLSVLGQALRDKDPVAREAAIQALAERGGSEAMDLLRQAFRQSDSGLKIMVIETIGSTPDALPLLREASQDPDVSVREAALAAIPE
jgi:HEAT repeats/HEAT repeat